MVRITFEAKKRHLIMPMDQDQYASLYTSPLSPLVQEVLEYTNAHHKHAHMISGHTQGMLLQMISQMIQPNRILEIGTFTGFSALCLAAGLTKEGLLFTLELREEDALTARRFFDRSTFSNQLIIKTGDARQSISSLQETWDLVFIDADKVSYIDYYEMIMPSLKQGGYILVDNVLFHGEVLAAEIKGKNAKAVAAFNAHALNDDRTEKVLLTVRDGLMLLRKK